MPSVGTSLPSMSVPSKPQSAGGEGPRGTVHFTQNTSKLLRYPRRCVIAREVEATNLLCRESLSVERGAAHRAPGRPRCG